ncbi:hypothetical protein MXD63_37100, partial [Frankia sp. Cpl3]|nr:hypothetical protein [Frankia sp. Cpl3]
GGTLINRVDTTYDTSRLEKSVEIDAIALSDLELIAIGAYSPLTGFLNKNDYESVVDRLRLADGTVWSIPITLPINEAVADELIVGEQIKLMHQGTVYGVLTVTEIYQPDKAR